MRRAGGKLEEKKGDGDMYKFRNKGSDFYEREMVFARGTKMSDKDVAKYLNDGMREIALDFEDMYELYQEFQPRYFDKKDNRVGLFKKCVYRMDLNFENVVNWINILVGAGYDEGYAELNKDFNVLEEFDELLTDGDLDIVWERGKWGIEQGLTVEMIGDCVRRLEKYLAKLVRTVR